jgi:predicted Zn-dependent peptidase
LRSQGSNIGGIYVTAVDANQAVGLMLAEIKRLQTEPVDQNSIDATAAEFLTNYYTGQETNAAQAGNLAEYEILGGGWRNSFETINRLLAVRPADVQRAAQTYMKNLQFVVLGDSARIDRAVFLGQK